MADTPAPAQPAAIIGPGPIVMVGDSDAGAFATDTQAGQNDGTSLLWTLLRLVAAVVLAAAVLFPNISGAEILWILGGGAAVLTAGALVTRLLRTPAPHSAINRTGQASWRMPPIEALTAVALTPAKRLWRGVLRFYLVVAVAMVIFRIIEPAIARS